MRSVQLLIIYFLVPFAICDKFDFIENSSKISEPLDQMYLKRKQGNNFDKFRNSNPLSGMHTICDFGILG